MEPEISSKQREKYRPAWELTTVSYHDRKGIDMPYTRKMIQKSAFRKERTTNRFMLCGRRWLSIGFPVPYQDFLLYNYNTFF